MRLELDPIVIKHEMTNRMLYPIPETGTTRTQSIETVGRRFERGDIQKNPKDSYGFRAPSSYYGRLTEYRPPSVECTIVYLDRRVGPFQEIRTTEAATSFAHIFGSIHGTPANWENSLKQQALRSIKDQKVNLSMTLAFLPQTLKMIRGNFSTIGSVLQSAQRADWQNVGRLLRINPKSTSSFYLEVLFGWLQLLRDTQGIVEELHRKCNKPSIRYIYGRARRSQELPPINQSHKVNGGWADVGIYNFSGDRKIDHNLVMIYRGETALLSRLSQLGLTNPMELLWDLVPWSWVVNMGVSIGDFIATLDATVGLTYVGGTYTRYSRTAGPVTVTEIPLSGGAGNWNNGSFNSTPGFYEEMSFNRSIITDKVDPFVLKNPFGSPIALTAAVIAAVVQKGRKATPQPPRGPTRFIYRRRGTRNLPPITYRP